MNGESVCFRRWQLRTIVCAMIGYALFYFIRKNLAVALPSVEADLGISKVQLGVFLTLHGLLYGFSRLFNGMWADRMSARVFMVLGLLLSCAMNVCFGLSSTAVLLGVFWVINGWVQGMGAPPCARLMTHWIPAKKLASLMTVWNASHSIGAFVAVVACGAIISVGLGWRWCFFLPAALCTLGAAFLWWGIRDTPRSVGLPELDGNTIESDSTGTKPSVSFREILMKHVFGNRVIWILALANFFVYIVRFGVLDWGFSMLREQYPGISPLMASVVLGGFEFAGIFGMMASGWVTDRFFGSRCPRTCVLCMAGAGLFILCFSFLSADHTPWWLATLVLGGAGFFTYGPQALVGVASANIATKVAAGTATGFTAVFGYLSTLVSGIGVGWVAKNWGWQPVLWMLAGAAVCGLVLFAAIWNAASDGYGREAR